ncbi:hypothetical protein DO97_15015 [Neosynechococcus sphagnicola sy1]|uniref:GH16 domain-containing protein n=1 Tax=Neosynechococcus sphagnicola sy1 TaxID=1497020 RepID=A0A098TIN5_9CYAN|nr:glycoside hydrolase family 16 protein [Neosynechococcus sphagnicola]KGF71847.1 hypothetical protein DO97_15015 [Neosynechococcus sphagnicola sy1]
MFDKSINKNIWNVYSGSFASSANACFTTANSLTINGLLNLRINRTTNPCNRSYSSSGLDTYQNYAQNYGRWEIVARFPSGSGTQGYAGLFAADGVSWPPEIDFAEVIGKSPQTLYLTQHYSADGSTQQSSFSYNNGSDWTAGFHVYRLDWVPGQLKYYVDGVLVLTQPQLFTPVPQGMKLAMGTGTGNCGSWADCPSAQFNSATMQVDYVRIYKYNP